MDLSEGFYPITDFKTKKLGVMTEDGKVLVSPKYDEVGEFRCGMCRVWIAEKGNTQVWDNWGQTFYIDKKGKIADPDKIMREAYDAQRQSSWY